jgi:hypothetical protein
VAAEVVRALQRPQPTERTAGGLYVPAVALDALLPNRMLRPIGIVARLGWRARQRRPPSSDDVFAQPTSTAKRSGELSSRRSILGILRDLLTPARP